jgi:hypothetical protein
MTQRTRERETERTAASTPFYSFQLGAKCILDLWGMPFSTRHSAHIGPVNSEFLGDARVQSPVQAISPQSRFFSGLLFCHQG